MNIELIDGRLRFCDRLVVPLYRILRLPDDDHIYGLGLLPVLVRPEDGVDAPVFIVLLLPAGGHVAHFLCSSMKSNAVQVVADRTNADSSLPAVDDSFDQSQNYLVCPNQPWVEGRNLRDSVIRRFVAVHLGEGYGLTAGTSPGE